MKKVIVRLLLVGVIVGAGFGVYHLMGKLPEHSAAEMPTAKVRRGDVVIRTYTRGELQATRSVTLTAPNLYGTVQITRLAAAGSLAREKDLIVEFDDAELRSRLEEKELEIEQIDEQIKKAKADLAIRDNQDEVDLLRARYSVRRAELEVQRNELLSAIDARKNLLNLEEAKRRLQQLESDIQSRRAQAEAELAVLNEQRNKALLENERETRRLSSVRLLAPMAGLVDVQQNRSASMMFGMQVPDLREGDEVSPGTPVARLLDMSELEVLAKVGELDRANLREGQEVIMTLDAIPGRNIHGRIKGMSGTASVNIFSGDPSKKFDVLFSVDMRELFAAVGAKQEEINRLLSMAERNRGRGVPSAGPAPMAPGFGMFARGGAPGGGPGGGGPGGSGGGFAEGGPQGRTGAGGPGGPGGFARGGGGAGQGGQGGGRFGNLSEEDRKKFQEALQKELKGRNMQDLSQEERTAIFQKLRAATGAVGRRAPGQGGPGGPAAGGPPQEEPGPVGRFSAADLANAKLPPPPGENSGFNVLLRPGLLADVEIIVEKLENALYVPNQALFEKEGHTVVYVYDGRRYEARPVQPVKQSESVMVIREGVQEGEEVLLVNPEAKPGAAKSKEGESGGAGGVPMGPGGARRNAR